VAHSVIPATQRFGSFRSEADIQRVALTKPDLRVRAPVDAGEEVRDDRLYMYDRDSNYRDRGYYHVEVDR
jgi:hypothetical protein